MADQTVVATRYASTHVRYDNNSGTTNYKFTPIEATLGRPNGTQAASNQRSTRASLIVNGGFNFNIPEDALITKVRFRFVAQNNPLSTRIYLQSPDGVIFENVESAAPNSYYTASRSFTPKELNNIEFGWFTQTDMMTYYSYLDALEIEVSYVDHREMTQHRVDVYGVETMPAPDTDFFGTTGGKTYLGEKKFLGAPDGITAVIPTAANSSQYKLGVRMEDLNIPEDARIDEVYVRITTGPLFATGSWRWSVTNDFISPSNILASGSTNNTSPWLKLAVTPQREDIVGDNYLQLTFSGSSRKEVDAFQITVVYSVPTTTTGSEVKYWDGSGWTTISDFKVWNGSSWANLEYTIY